ncbi:YihY/virulence factor BrkB family protein [Bremerella cremea]|uniref:YihY/virulence factor BrkB family protein n=1 Tax=Bremerella cremea TaxID=1031537 RepID=UPI0031E70A48
MLEPWKKFCSQIVFRWVENDHSTSAAAIAFYVIFSLAPILVFAVAIAGEVLESDTSAREAAIAFLNTSLNVASDNEPSETEKAPANGTETKPDSADPAKPETEEEAAEEGEEKEKEAQFPAKLDYGKEIVDQVRLSAFREATMLQTITLSVIAIWSASATFMQLRAALNRINGFVAEGIRDSVIAVLLGRVRATLFSIGVGLMLAVATLLSTWSHIIFDRASDMGYTFFGKPDWLPTQLISWLTVLTVFYCMLRFLPMKRPPWREVLCGAIIGTVCFQLGKYLIIPLGEKNVVATAYVNSRFLVITVMWIFLSSHVLLFAAEIGHMLFAPDTSPFAKYRLKTES